MTKAKKILKLASSSANVTPSQASGSPQSSEGLRALSQEGRRVIQTAIGVSGDVQSALLWYCNEQLSPFDCKTAEQLVAEGRVDDLLRYIASLEAGATG
ncbi:hypothetical protein [Burkholderia cepacia]|uniref:hypothetical protein n=1 Tax=Burkholderia cepacia TaxID=292 RepID=UPI001CF4AF38|nr:hypothetical protein [Burkholderia cepacia]MCA8323788.1 hypothetical protein [Burkholderia cepacia]